MLFSSTFAYAVSWLTLLSHHTACLAYLSSSCSSRLKIRTRASSHLFLLVSLQCGVVLRKRPSF